MNQRYREYGRSIALGALAGVTMAVIFAAGFFARDFVRIPITLNPNAESYPLLDEVEILLRRHFLRELPDNRTLQYGAIRGVLQQLNDRNTFFIEPAVAQSESDALAGTYGGIGVQLRRSQTGEFLLTPFEGSPALEAGIEDGDILVRVDDLLIEPTMQQDEVDQLLRGEVRPGNGVEVTVEKADGSELTRFIEFDVINVPSVLWRVMDEAESVGYIQLLRFTNRTPSELETAITDLREAGIQGLVLDIRNNGGGLLQEAIRVSEMFLDGGVVVYERTNEGEEPYYAAEGGLMTDVPLVVLVNNNTASASELLAGAIQDRRRGILIGQRTYGKGTIQQIFSLSDSSSIHVTSAEWLTPEQQGLDGVGLEPNIAMIPDENGRDVEIGEAVRYLQQQIAQRQEE
jgi:carboxyl-terminal processing protease